MFSEENLFPTVPCCRRCSAADAPGWPQTDMHGGSYQTPLCLQHPPPYFSTSLSLALCPGGGQTLPSALLAKWNLYFSHILLGRWYTFFFFLFYFYILKIFPRLLESQASCFVLPGHILSDSILTAKA